MMRRHYAGFTLLEILIAMFIFTIISLILVGALRGVINTQSGTDKSAERLRKLQMALLIMSRDIEQTIDRPVLNEVGKENQAFVGSPREITFTHTGLANPTGMLARTTMQRTAYIWHDNALWRSTWAALDLAPDSEPHTRKLLDKVTEVRFQFLDKDGRFYDYWPGEGQTKQSIPRAVRVYLKIPDWGSMSQLYVISAQPISREQQKPAAPPTPAPKS